MANKVKNIKAEDVDSLDIKTGLAGDRMGEIKGWIPKARFFLRDVKTEFDKVNWSNKKETVSMAMAVLAISIFFAAYLGVVDLILSKLVRFLIKG
ncbi:preprotein translocase subunit SecE [Dissulfurimicrobium hydrothermale]|uniref:preprotein translocase subunit SecE n=1 Tax=Dissulfurimicrobium hydrothermale TaxID=1750598 RepID=UPI001EDA2304|nr:preprotein translocase subunit SecE [Dissulfurimicrobium hydrothermale]UKL14458.1 preprotein translocase subunit SecE [Dissulfurimicrobium hydrothermale]